MRARKRKMRAKRRTLKRKSFKDQFSNQVLVKKKKNAKNIAFPIGETSPEMGGESGIPGIELAEHGIVKDPSSQEGGEGQGVVARGENDPKSAKLDVDESSENVVAFAFEADQAKLNFNGMTPNGMPLKMGLQDGLAIEDFQMEDIVGHMKTQGK